MKTSDLSVMVRLSLLAMAILLIVIMTVCLLSVPAAFKLIDMIGLQSLFCYLFTGPFCQQKKGVEITNNNLSW